MGVRLRVHFAAVGFEAARVYEPILGMAGERVVLLTSRGNEKADRALTKIRNVLEARGVRHTTVEVDLWDSNHIVGEIGAIVASAPGHEYFFNVSAGPKPACIGGTIAGMLWHVVPYYVKVDYARELEWQEDHPVLGTVQLVPTFDVEVPDEASLSTLSFLASRSGPVDKLSIITHLRESRIIQPKRSTKKTGVTPQAYQAQADVILRKLEEMGYVSLHRAKNRLYVVLEERGRHGLKMFAHLSSPRAPLTLLQP